MTITVQPPNTKQLYIKKYNSDYETWKKPTE